MINCMGTPVYYSLKLLSLMLLMATSMTAIIIMKMTAITVLYVQWSVAKDTTILQTASLKDRNLE